MAGLALPLAFVILRRHAASKSRRPLVVPVLVGAAILALVPVWNQQTLGDWRLDPYPHYSQRAFSVRQARVRRECCAAASDAGPPMMAAVGDWSRELHEKHVVTSASVGACAARRRDPLAWFADGWRGPGRPRAGCGVMRSVIERLALIPAAICFSRHLLFAHPPMWIVYYFEVLPILYYLAACQLGRLFHGLEPSVRPAPTGLHPWRTRPSPQRCSCCRWV